MIGRTSERARCLKALDNASEGTSSVLTIWGEAGIGKTALLQEVLNEALARGFDVRRVTGVPSESAMPYAGLNALLLHDLRNPNLNDVLAVAAGLVLAPTTPLVPSIAAALLVHLSTLAEAKPIVLIVDDLQWIDRSSVSVLEGFVRGLKADRIAVLLATRTDPNRLFDRSAELEDTSWIATLDSIVLTPLSERESVDVLVSQGVEIARATSIAKYADGLPLALMELVAARAGESPMGRLANDRVINVASLYADRFETLSAEVRLVCVAVAIEDSISAVSAFVGNSFDNDCATAIELGLVVVNGDSIQFRHPLLRQAALQGTSPMALRRLHLGIANALDPKNNEDRIALHLAASAIGPDETVAERLAAFGERARGRGALQEASNALMRSAEISPDPVLRARRLLNAAETMYIDGVIDASLEVVSSVLKRSPNLDVNAEAEVLYARIAEWDRCPAEVVQRLIDFADRIELTAPLLSAWSCVHASGMAMMAGDITAGVSTAQRALRIAEEHDDFFAVMRAKGNLVWNLLLIGRVGESEDIVGPIEALIKLAAASENIEGVSVAQALSMMYVMNERWDEADGILSMALPLARRLSARLSVVLLGMVRGNLLWRKGRWEEGWLLSTEDLVQHELPAISWAWGNAAAAQIAASRGLGDEVRMRTDESIAASRRLDLPLVSAWAFAARGHLALSSGDFATARNEYERVVAITGSIGLVEPGFFLWHGDWVASLIGSNDLVAAKAALEVLLGIEEQTGRQWLQGVIARANGQLCTDAAAAQGQFVISTTTFESLGMPFEQARTHLAFADWLIGNERTRTSSTLRSLANEQLELAIANFVRLGANQWLQTALLLRDTSSQNDSLPAQGTNNRGPYLRELLTPAELRVALSVVNGTTNRETAQELHVSEKTVEYHLQSIFRKLGVSNRGACVAAISNSLG
jgi:DNA-binding CsgD family transcriptional regulator/tetratricopeptide (TPR) repeat protein